ncbi:hypothetical protein BN1708_017108, partial [Verticillium longisporum]
MTYDLFGYGSAKNGRLLGFVGLVASLLQGGVTRRLPPLVSDHHEDDYKWTTSTITATHISTVIDCGDKDCYGGGGQTQYTTVTIPQTTTICPVPVAPEPTPEKPEEPEQPYPEPPVETQPVPTPEPPVETQPTVGLTAGHFMSYTVFLAFNSKDFANRYFRSTPLDTGLMSLSGYLTFWGWAYLAITIGLALFKREEKTRNEDGIWDVYQIMWGVLKLKNIQTIIVVHLIAKIGFQANDAVT